MWLSFLWPLFPQSWLNFLATLDMAPSLSLRSIRPFVPSSLHPFVPSSLHPFVPSCLRLFILSSFHPFVSSSLRLLVPSSLRSISKTNKLRWPGGMRGAIRRPPEGSAGRAGFQKLVKGWLYPRPSLYPSLKWL